MFLSRVASATPCVRAVALFLRRLDDPTLKISRSFEANFDEPTTEKCRRIKAAIDEHRLRIATKTEQDLFSEKTRLAAAERSLKAKETKKARDDVRISTNKFASLKRKAYHEQAHAIGTA